MAENTIQLSSPTETVEHLFNGAELNHIALWMPNWIGDVILAMPALEVLRRKFPNTRITAIVREPSDQLLSRLPSVDSVIRAPHPREGLMRQMAFAWSLRKYHFDLGVAFPNSINSAMLIFLSGAKQRMGYDTESRAVFLTHLLPITRHEKKTLYRVDYFCRLFAELKLDPPEKTFVPLELCPEDRSENEILNIIHARENDLVVTVHPGTSKPARAWHADRFGILCQKLIKTRKAKIVLLGNEKEEALLKQVRNYCTPGAVYSIPQMNLREIALLLKNSTLFIGNDSGMMHLAAMVGTPLVGIFGPGSPATTGPYMEAARKEIITRSYPCSPCRQRFFKECKASMHRKPYCLEDISVKEVYEAVERLLHRTKTLNR